MTEELDLQGRLAQFIDRKVKLARKQLAQSGETSELPIYFSTLRALVLTHEDWKGVRTPEMLETVTQVAAFASLELVSGADNAWDLPEAIKDELKPKPRDIRGQSQIDPTYKPPTRIVVSSASEIPKAKRRERHAGADGDWSGEQTYNIDDM